MVFYSMLYSSSSQLCLKVLLNLLLQNFLVVSCEFSLINCHIWVHIVFFFSINGPFAALTSYLSEFHGTKHRARVQMVLGTIFSIGSLILPLLALVILPLDIQLKVNSFSKSISKMFPRIWIYFSRISFMERIFINMRMSVVYKWYWIYFSTWKSKISYDLWKKRQSTLRF